MGTRFGNVEDDPLSSTTLEFAVEMRSPSCVEKVRKALHGYHGVKNVSFDLSTQKMIIEGNVVAEVIKNYVEENTGLSTVFMGHGSSMQNLGAGVAAISVGESSVRGLLRFVQLNTETCAIEGTLDNLPVSEPVYVSLHEAGDLSSGCESCGSLYQHGSGFNGIISKLSVTKDERADFRLALSTIKVPHMIGRCVVIHQGDVNEIEQNKSKRLACGIVARASGVFENSKRFCACDGVSIWEQKSKERECAK